MIIDFCAFFRQSHGKSLYMQDLPQKFSDLTGFFLATAVEQKIVKLKIQLLSENFRLPSENIGLCYLSRLVLSFHSFSTYYHCHFFSDVCKSTVHNGSVNIFIFFHLFFNFKYWQKAYIEIKDPIKITVPKRYIKKLNGKKKSRKNSDKWR